MKNYNNFRDIIRDIIKIVLITVCIIFVFFVTCRIWFKGLGHPVQEKQIIISLETYSNNIDSNTSKEIDSKLKNNQKQIEEVKTLISELKGYQKQLNDSNSEFTNKEYLTISTLNGFYAALFTAITVLIGIAGFAGWRTIKRIEKLKEIEKKVYILHKKKDYVKWVKQKIVDDKSYVGSSELSLNKEDKSKLNKIQTYLIEEFTENSWLEILLAKQFLDDGEYEKAFKIYHFIEQRDLLDSSSKIESVLYHMIGQLYSEYYFNKSTKGYEPGKYHGFDKLGHDGEIISEIEHLIITKKYYEQSLNIRKERKIRMDETLGSLAVVLIELYIKENDKDKLKEAIKHLHKVISLNKETYNTYFGLARAKYLENNDEEEVKKYLFKAVEKINTIKQKDDFMNFIEKDKQLKNINDWDKIKNEIKEKTDKKLWLKQ